MASRIFLFLFDWNGCCFGGGGGGVGHHVSPSLVITGAAEIPHGTPDGSRTARGDYPGSADGLGGRRALGVGMTTSPSLSSCLTPASGPPKPAGPHVMSNQQEVIPDTPPRSIG